MAEEEEEEEDDEDDESSDPDIKDEIEASTQQGGPGQTRSREFTSSLEKEREAALKRLPFDLKHQDQSFKVKTNRLLRMWGLAPSVL